MNTTKPMLALSTLLTGALLTGPALADEPAVSEVNVELGASQIWVDSKIGSPDAGILSGSLSIQAPLGERVGISISGERGHGDYAERYPDYYETDITASVFLRRPETGGIGIGIGNSSARIANQEFESDFYYFEASAYLSSLSVAVGAIEENPKGGANNSYGIAGIAWYVDPNLLVGLVTGFMDSKETYRISLQQQIGLGGFAYRVAYDSKFDRDYDRYSLDLIYRLARPKSLMDRHRKDL